MAEQPIGNDGSPEQVSMEELVVSNMLETQALIQLLTERGIITQDELMQKIQFMSEEMHRRRQSMN